MAYVTWANGAAEGRWAETAVVREETSRWRRKGQMARGGHLSHWAAFDHRPNQANAAGSGLRKVVVKREVVLGRPGTGEGGLGRWLAEGSDQRYRDERESRIRRPHSAQSTTRESRPVRRRSHESPGFPPAHCCPAELFFGSITVVESAGQGEFWVLRFELSSRRSVY